MDDQIRIIQLADIAALVVSVVLLFLLGVGTFAIGRRLRRPDRPRILALVVPLFLLLGSVVLYYSTYIWIARVTATAAYGRVESAEQAAESGRGRATNLLFGPTTFLCVYPGVVVRAAPLVVFPAAGILEMFVARRRRRRIEAAV